MDLRKLANKAQVIKCSKSRAKTVVQGETQNAMFTKQERVLGSNHHGLIMVPTKDRGGLPRSAPGACHRCGIPLSSKVHCFLLQIFRCHAISAVLSCTFVLKRLGFGCKRIIFHDHFQHVKTPLTITS